MQLPFFLKKPAVAIIGDTCYTSLIEDFNYRDVPCIKYAISKGLGFGIVAGGAIVKVPQIIKIISARSAVGVSLSSYMLETLACVISLAYNIRALAFLQAATIPINLFSKVPQIIENYKNGSTGQLAAFTDLLPESTLHLTEVDDIIILSGFMLSTLFNCILALQMALYWNNKAPAVPVKGEKGSSLAGPSETKKRVKKLD
ncbi:hypothetical protein BCR41DRAFT_378314 [Lobosporangium transversale]|uniref:Mannose-P-dolichol utilization defect 1 protein homolog n=1 Tax=Lobosporangium transversale TaxID=64571 RepID=A0A1Y2GHQ1_9FUNG|nr:hypothetical protein BCR41DRAFT_378314 [Lobosporangium transversale]ORZ11050.1 hypothetical protein BCR41DRAFT_378314 [Lobosporangium transversale]|eukprot:XP_021879567.1 hypothetical protein BCR41DRAFT_378314 [Lobosporangium transversale]